MSQEILKMNFKPFLLQQYGLNKICFKAITCQPFDEFPFIHNKIQINHLKFNFFRLCFIEVKKIFFQTQM